MGIQNTTAGLGGAAAVSDIVVWLLDGHPTPVPEDVQTAIMVVAGVMIHAGYLLTLYFGRKLFPGIDGQP